MAAAAALGLAAAGSLQAAGTEVYIGVEGSRGEAPRWDIGMPPFTLAPGSGSAEGELARRMRDVVRADLAFSRVVRPVEPPSGEAAADPKGRSEDWRRAGASFVLSGRLSTPPGEAGGAPGAKASVAATLLDLASGEALFDRYYRQDRRHWRTLAHQISDDIVGQLTGRSGVARSRMAFVNNATGHKEVYLVDYDGDGLRQLTRDRSIALLPRWLPGGRALLFTSYRRMNPDLVSLDLQTGEARTFLDHQGLNLAGGFSPDGSRLVLTQSRGRSPDIYLLEMAGRSLRALTDHFGVDSSPTFAPDGNQVAFVSDRSGNPQVHVLDSTTGRVRRLTRLNWCDSPAWSPNGEWIAFAGRANPKDRIDIFLVDAAGSQVRQLTHGQGSNEDPSWSPDGRFLAFTSTRRRRRELYVMDSDGSAPRPVGEIPGDSFTPSWSP